MYTIPISKHFIFCCMPPIHIVFFCAHPINSFIIYTLRNVFDGKTKKEKVEGDKGRGGNYALNAWISFVLILPLSLSSTMATAVSRGSSFDTLPYEVKIRIFSRLPFCERVRLTRVSQSWRQFLLNWPEMFERIENRCDCAFERDLSYTMCQLNHALLPYAPYIQPKAFRDLSLLMLSDNTANQKNMILEVS